MTEASLLQGLKDNLQDWPRWLVIADYYEEQGNLDMAAACRYCFERKIHPKVYDLFTYWFSESSLETRNYCLPANLINSIKEKYQNNGTSKDTGPGIYGVCCVPFNSLKEAIEALGDALVEENA